MKFLNKNYKRNNYRIIRISQELKKEISNILQSKFMDPRVNFLITVSMVKVSHDLSYAKVFVSYINTIKSLKDKYNNINNILHVLKKAVGYIRFMLSKTMKLRKIPILNFYSDNSLIEGIKISNLLKKI